jgi:hypothetical protein
MTASANGPSPVVTFPVAVVSLRHDAEAARAIDALVQSGSPSLVVCLDQRKHRHEGADVQHPARFSGGAIASLVLGMVRDPARAVRALTRLTFAGRPDLVAVAMQLAKTFDQGGISAVRPLDSRAAFFTDTVRSFFTGGPQTLDDLPIDWEALGADRVEVRWITRRINSIAAEVSWAAGGRRAVVKRQREHGGLPAGQRFLREASTLTALEKALPGGALRVPRILQSSPGAALLVMERAPGAALDSLFAEARTSSDAMTRLRAAVRGAGAWLAAMQDATWSTTDHDVVLAAVLRAAKEDLERVAPRHRGLSRRRLGAILEKRPVFATAERRVVGHHDDYWPGNIFFDGASTGIDKQTHGTVTVIDFESYREGLPLEDAAFFLIRCELLRRRFRLSFPDLKDCFFEGYGRTPEPAVLRLFMVTSGLRALARGFGDDLPLPQRLWTHRTILRAMT